MYDKKLLILLCGLFNSYEIVLSFRSNSIIELTASLVRSILFYSVLCYRFIASVLFCYLRFYPLLSHRYIYMRMIVLFVWTLILIEQGLRHTKFHLLRLLQTGRTAVKILKFIVRSDDGKMWELNRCIHDFSRDCALQIPDSISNGWLVISNYYFI